MSKQHAGSISKLEAGFDGLPRQPSLKSFDSPFPGHIHVHLGFGRS